MGLPGIMWVLWVCDYGLNETTGIGWLGALSFSLFVLDFLFPHLLGNVFLLCSGVSGKVTGIGVLAEGIDYIANEVWLPASPGKGPHLHTPACLEGKLA